MLLEILIATVAVVAPGRQPTERADAGSCIGDPRCGSPPPAPAPTGAEGESLDIVVTGSQRPGQVVTDHRPVMRLERAAIARLGTVSLGKLLERLAPVTTGSDGSLTVILLNGRRIAGEEEIASLPPEAIERIEILPEPVAAQFGYPTTARVTNVITVRRFTALLASGSIHRSVGEGAGDRGLEGTGTLLRGDLRALGGIEVTRRPRITDASGRAAGGDRDEGAIGSPSSGPGSSRATLSLAGPLGRSLGGSIAVDIQSKAAERVSGVSSGEEETRRRLTAFVQGFLRRWNWTLKTEVEARQSERWSGPAASLANSVGRIRERGLDAKAGITIVGPVGRASGGDIILTAAANVAAAHGKSVTVARGGVSLRRAFGSASATVNLPISVAETGTLAVGLTGTASQTSAHPLAIDWGATVNWNPDPLLRLTLAANQRSTPPDVGQLASAIAAVRVPPTMEGAGGRPSPSSPGGPHADVGLDQRRSFDVGLDVQPLPDAQFRFGVSFSDVTESGLLFGAFAYDRIRAQASGLAYGLDVDGGVLASGRTFSGHAVRHQQSLSSSVSYSAEIGPGAVSSEAIANPQKSPWFAMVSVDAKFALRDRVVPTAGPPSVDQLGRQAVGLDPGLARWDVTALANLTRSSLGISASVQWCSPLLYRHAPEAEAVRHNARPAVQAGGFVTMDGLFPSSAWARGMRAEVAVDNLLGRRESARIGLGVVREDLGAAVAPTGPVVTITVRKLL